MRQARAERGAAAAGLLPEGELSAGYNRSLGSRNVVLPLGAIARDLGRRCAGRRPGRRLLGQGFVPLAAEVPAPPAGLSAPAPAAPGSSSAGRRAPSERADCPG